MSKFKSQANTTEYFLFGEFSPNGKYQKFDTLDQLKAAIPSDINAVEIQINKGPFRQSWKELKRTKTGWKMENDSPF